MSWENIPAFLTCRRAKMPPCSLAFAVGQLDDIVNKYKNTYHRIIKNKPVHVRPSIYVDFNKENNKEDPKFKVSDHVRI